MAGIKISELPEASTPFVGDEVVAIVQNNCTKFAHLTSISSSGDISDVLVGEGLQGGGSSGSVTVGVNTNCLDRWDGTNTTLAAASGYWDDTYTSYQANSGVWNNLTDCVGTVTSIEGGDGITGSVTNSGCLAVDSTVVRTTGAQSIAGNKSFTNNILSAGVNLDQLFGAGGGSGTITSVCGTAGLSGFANSGGAVIGIDSGALTSFDQSSCPGLNCTGTVVASDISSFTDCVGNVCGSGTNNVIPAFSTSTSLTDSKLRQTFTEVIAGATLSATGGLSTSGQILSGGCDLHNLFGSGGGGGTTIAGGTDNKLAMFNSAGDNIEDSIITQSTALQVTVGGTLSADHIAVGTDANVSTSVAGNSVIGGLSGSALSNHSVTIGGCYPYIDTTGAANAVIAGERNTIGTSSNRSTVIGGCENTVSNSTNMVTMIGGEQNTSGSTNCTVFIGGQANSAAAFSSGLIVIGGSCHNATGSNTIYIGDSASCAAAHNVNLSAKLLTLRHLPTSDPVSAGVVWSDGGTLKVSAG